MDHEDHAVSVQKAAKLLGRQLCGRVPHVVGVSLRRSDPNTPKLDIYVDIDSEKAASQVPSHFLNHKVHVRLVGTPRFATV